MARGEKRGRMLREGRVYRVVKPGVVLMPQRDPVDPMKALTTMRQIEVGASFIVKAVNPKRPTAAMGLPVDMTPWYHVVFPGTPIQGWINSVSVSIDCEVEACHVTSDD